MEPFISGVPPLLIQGIIYNNHKYYNKGGSRILKRGTPKLRTNIRMNMSHIVERSSMDYLFKKNLIMI